MITEADTCRKYVLPLLIEAGWDEDPHSFTEQKSFTDGRIVMAGTRARRRPPKRADYLLRYTRDYLIGVVEAKAAYKAPGEGLQQAMDYAEMLGLKFAYATTVMASSSTITYRGKKRASQHFPRRMSSGSGFSPLALLTRASPIAC